MKKRDDFDFDIVNFPFLDGDVPRCPFRVYTFRNLLGLLFSAITLRTSTREINAFNALIFPILRDCLQSVCIFLSLTTTTLRYRIEGH